MGHKMEVEETNACVKKRKREGRDRKGESGERKKERDGGGEIRIQGFYFHLYH